MWRRQGKSSLVITAGRVGALDHLPYACEVAWCHVTSGKQVAHERGHVTVEQALGELLHHRVLDISLRDECPVHELAVPAAPLQHASALQSRDDGRDGRLREMALRVQ